MMKTTTITIPAQPGFDLAVLVSGPHEFCYYPIIAWVVEVRTDDDEYKHSYVYPVTPEWNCNDDKLNHPIRRPDGIISFADGLSFQKGEEAEAIAHAVEEERRREEMARKAAEIISKKSATAS